MSLNSALTSLTKAELIQRVRRMEKQALVLEEQIAALSRQPLVTHKHEGAVTGKAAEEFIAELLAGESTTRNAGHDLIVKGGQRVEVKGSKCNTFKNTADGPDRQSWTWHNFLGVGKQMKTYHRLILVGEAPPEHCTEFRDPMSPFVIFDVPIRIARQIASERRDERGLFAYRLMARPSSAKSSRWNRVLWTYEVTRDELIARYRK